MRTSNVWIGWVAGGFIGSPVARSKRAPWTGQEIQPDFIRPQSSVSWACEHSLRTAKMRSAVWHSRIGTPSTVTTFFVPAGTSSNVATAMKFLSLIVVPIVPVVTEWRLAAIQIAGCRQNRKRATGSAPLARPCGRANGPQRVPYRGATGATDTMNFEWTEEQRAFRKTLQSFLKANLPDDWEAFSKHGPASPALTAFAATFCRKLADNGLLFPHWPKEIGGEGLGPWEPQILAEVMWEWGEPRGGQDMNS